MNLDPLGFGHSRASSKLLLFVLGSAQTPLAKHAQFISGVFFLPFLVDSCINTKSELDI